VNDVDSLRYVAIYGSWTRRGQYSWPHHDSIISNERVSVCHNCDIIHEVEHGCVLFVLVVRVQPHPILINCAMADTERQDDGAGPVDYH
jgi:hypothetical protein